MHPFVNTAITAARKAGSLIARSVERRDLLKITPKGPNDFVTEIDLQAEDMIIRILRKNYPSHGIWGEETGYTAGDDYVWLIDPLDGTNNFVRDFPHYAVSIALQYKGKTEHGVIYDPIRNELFTASRGKGAFINDRRMRVSGRKELAGAFLATAMPLHHPELQETALHTIQQLVPHTPVVRCTGSCVLDLAYVAAGRLDAHWRYAQNTWDLAAGVLMVKEAGGLVSDFDGSENYLASGNVLTATPKIFKTLLQALNT